MDSVKINIFSLLLSFSHAIDMVAPQLNNHHQQVAYLAYRIAEQMQLSAEAKRNILIGGMLHDIGALSIAERLSAIEEEPVTINSHAFRGAKMIEEFSPFKCVSNDVRFHHVGWDNGNGQSFMGTDVPLASHLLHIADRISVMFNKNDAVLVQTPKILAQVRDDPRFMPDMISTLMDLGKMEYVWLELNHDEPLSCMPFKTLFETIDLDDMIGLTKMFSFTIDFRSHFTATHSAGVAATAEKLGEICGLSKNECKMLLIAGYLHDLGKLAIPNALLEKPSPLDEKEFEIIRSHTFYTYKLLESVEGFATINKWASFHHEKLNGKGYPFHLQGDDIPFGARIMAIADIFTAITEHRPYREAMSKEQVIRVLKSMAENGSICREILTILFDHFDLLTETCKTSQFEADAYYRQFSKD